MNRPYRISFLLVLFCAATLSHAEPLSPISDFKQKTVYHSPQTPGYTAWCTLWGTPQNELRLAFQQITGPVEDWTKRQNLTILMGSADAGETWTSIREVPARPAVASPEGQIYAAPGSSAFCGHGFAALKDGTLVTGLWAGPGEKTGYIQRSTDEGKTWSPPIYLKDPQTFKIYPSQIHQLRDGRLVLVGGTVKQSDAQTAKYLLKEFFESRDAGKTWSLLWTMPANVGLCEESDFVELDNGDLLFVHRAEHYDGNKLLYSDRLQNIFHRKGKSWDIGPVTKMPIPHSGYPELLKLREGPILHIATDGVWQTIDQGASWSKLPLPGSPYYPRATQLNDGRVLIVGHVGGDDEYGKVNQTIISQTFRVNVPSATTKATAPALNDLWEGKAAWVHDTADIGSAFGFHFPSIIAGDHEFCAYYLHNYTAPDGKFKMAIGRARGTDGINWTDDAMVLDVGGAGAWDDRLTSFPGAWKDGNTWYLVYEGASEDSALSPGDIGLATSTDGKTFTKHPNNPILRHNPSDWERANIGTPSLYKEDGIWYLFYHGYDFNVCQIGVASGKSLTHLTRSTANPILSVTPGATAWDTGTTGRRSAIVKEGIYYYFAFEGSTPQPFAQAKWSSGLARTTSLTDRWTKCPNNPMIPQTATGMSYDGPELLKIGDTWHLFVRHTTKAGGNATERFTLKPSAPKGQP